MKQFPCVPLIVNNISRFYLSQGDFPQAIALGKANLERLNALREKQAADGKDASWDMTPFVLQLLNALESNYLTTRNEALKLEADGKSAEAKQKRDQAMQMLEETKETAK